MHALNLYVYNSVFYSSHFTNHSVRNQMEIIKKLIHFHHLSVVTVDFYENFR